MPTTYPGIPVLTDGSTGRQIIPLVRKNNDGTKIDVGYLLRWSKADEGEHADPDGVWDGYVCTDNGADRLVINGASREGAAKAVLKQIT